VTGAVPEAAGGAPISDKAASKAAADGDLAELQRQVAGGAGLNQDHGSTPLLEAAINNRRDCLLWLLERGADANAANDKGSTALMWAAYFGDTKAVEALLLHGGNPARQDCEGMTAATFAKAKPAVLALLLQDPDEISWYTKVADRTMQEVYNFRLKERITLLRKAEGGDVEAMTRQSFCELADVTPLRRAFALHCARGGKTPEEEVFPTTLAKLPGPRPGMPGLAGGVR
jgi:hypothetical protein